ncbi:C6 zinc finger domain-containing protein [Fusarium mundagurra]|uniref:C6 zinc finger domain-containing protein n=1 Tax=Fusarium mundagurra TaxID=1567541 RepID=A0A8H5Y722_9HYPO|nr:C6 zinc finger domain-containing protein [Fusarium mundagurra]
MPRRSRGCQACRQRRIGCDGQYPVCNNCQQWNRQCSGPITSVIILDQTAKTTKRHSQPQHPFAQSQTGPLSNLRVSNSAVEAVAFQAEFFAFAIPDARASVKSFLEELQKARLQETAPTLDLAVRAVGLAFYATVSRNKPAAQKATELYIHTLQRHSRAVAASSTSLVPNLLAMLTSPRSYLSNASDTWPVFEYLRIQYIAAADLVFDRLLVELYILTDFYIKKCYQPNSARFPKDAPSRLDNLWKEFQEIQKSLTDQQQDSFKGVMTLTLSYFASSWILIALLHTETHTLQSIIDLHQACEMVLNCVKLLKERKSTSVHIKLFFPLVLVQLYSPIEDYRTRAKGYIETWLRQAVYLGLGAPNTIQITTTEF